MTRRERELFPIAHCDADAHPERRPAAAENDCVDIFNENFTAHDLQRLPQAGVIACFTRVVQWRKIMKRALIGSLSVLAMMVATQAANAQADINPNIYPTYRGAPVAQQPWEWYAGPGPVRRGSQCVVDVDSGRGYGFMKDCPAPQAAARPRARVAHRHARQSVYR
jgi:hypothetical protein